MTDTDALTAYLRQLERIKDDWDDRKYAEIEKDCLLPLWQLCRRMQETEHLFLIHLKYGRNLFPMSEQNR